MRTAFSVLIILAGLFFIGTWYTASYVPNAYIGTGAMFDANQPNDILALGVGLVLCLLGLLGRPLAGLSIAAAVFVSLALAGALSPGDTIFALFHANANTRLAYGGLGLGAVLLLSLAMRAIPLDQRA
ncbi:hypothetical protein [Xanthobacter sp. ZOL 2024]